MKKTIVLLTLIIATLSFSCNQSPSTTSSEPQPISGNQVFMKYCKLCHGANGKMGLNGAKLLPESTMSLEERITQITNGKGTMQAYKDLLSAEEIKAVAEFTMTLK
jgi:cytochrome c6